MITFNNTSVPNMHLVVGNNLQPLWYSCLLLTATGRPVKIATKIVVLLYVSLSEFEHTITVVDINDEVILSIDIIQTYRLI